MGVVHVAAGDCEAVRDARVAQPVNAGSSLAFVAAAVPVWRQGRRCRPLAVATGAVGLASAAYHGPGGTVARAAHDCSVLAVVVAAADRAAAAARRDRRALTGPALVAVAGLVVHRLSRTGGPWCRPGSVWQGHALWHVLAAAALVMLGGASREPAPVPGRSGGAGP